MLKNTITLPVFGILVIGVIAALYDGSLRACLADGSPFRYCAATGDCVSCNAGAAAIATVINNCTLAGGTIDIGGPEVCAY